MDHEDYCNSYINEIDVNADDPASDDFIENNNIKENDELLIDLYKERSFLYDKQNKHFKDIIMKSNAWIEISKLMIEIHKDTIYTPLYCQKRCTSLREQYNREKRRTLKECKSGSGASKRSPFPYFKQLSFLDKVVRRRSYTNCKISNVNNITENIDECCDTEFAVLSIDHDKENKTLCDRSVKNNNCLNKEHIPSRLKKRKVEETKSLENVLLQMGETMSSYMENKKTEKSSVDEAFMQYLKLQFDTFSEKEKLVRKKMIMDMLVAPIPDDIELHN